MFEYCQLPPVVGICNVDEFFVIDFLVALLFAVGNVAVLFVKVTRGHFFSFFILVAHLLLLAYRLVSLGLLEKLRCWDFRHHVFFLAETQKKARRISSKCVFPPPRDTERGARRRECFFSWGFSGNLFLSPKERTRWPVLATKQNAKFKDWSGTV